MKRTPSVLLVIVLFFYSARGSAQVFFKSNQAFTTDQLTKFYSSLAIEGDLVLFLANDYKLYAYEKLTGKELWNTALDYKSKKTCFVSEGIVFTPYYSKEQERTAQLDLATGKFIKLLPFGQLETNPILKNGILFGTAIYDGGAIFAYDIQQDSVLWWRFLAHGVSTQPYYFPGYIQANAEGNNWVRINYQGQLLDTTCREKADIFVSDIPCIKVFNALTHDGAELDDPFSKKIFNDEEAVNLSNTLRGVQHSFILYEDKLAIIGNKRKLYKMVDLLTLIPPRLTERNSGLTELISADAETISFLYLDLLIHYNFRKGKLESAIDLSEWEPSQVVPDGENIWLISRKNGLLYGLSF